MDYIKYFSKYKRLFKTKKAVEYFVKSYKNIDKRVEIMKYYWPKTGKPMGKVTWKDLADRVFSEFIRLKNADSKGKCKCVTCGIIQDRTVIQNGHFITRGNMKRRYIISNCHPQCYKCNCLLHGNYQQYTLYMINEYGMGYVNSMLNDSTIYKIKQQEYEQRILFRYDEIVEKKRKLSKVKKV